MFLITNNGNTNNCIKLLEDSQRWLNDNLTKFDLEAEREGSAVKRHTVLRSAWGKGTIKSRRGRKDAEAAIERRTVKGYYARSV